MARISDIRRPILTDERYSGLSTAEASREYERDLLLYEQTVAMQQLIIKQNFEENFNDKNLVMYNCDDIDEIVITSATELEFWVKTPNNIAHVDELSTSQVLHEHYWTRTKGKVRTALEETLLLMEAYGFDWKNMKESDCVAELMKMHNIPLSKVVQHNNWSGKNCPQYLREGKHGYNWSWFIEQVKKYYNGTTSSTPSTSNDYKRIVGTIEILADSLNVRKDADFNSAVVTTLKKGQKVSVMAIQNGLYMIKEGQWCSAGEKYVKYTETKEDVYEVTADTLNVRSGRGTEHAKVGTLKKGDRVAIWSVGKDSKGENWGSFRYSFTPDVVGYIHMGYLKKI